MFDVENWTQVGSVLVGLVKRFPDVKYLDVGGGLGVPDRIEGRELDLERLDEALAKVKSALPGVELWLEPGRYFVANAGVLLARVTQTKVQERHSLRGRRHRHELADPSGAVWRASRHRESHALR